MTRPKPLDFHTPVSELTSVVAIEYDVAHAPIVVLDFDQWSDETVRVRIRRPETGETRYRRGIKLDQELGELALIALREKPLRAVELPCDGEIEELPRRLIRPAAVFFTLGAITFLIMVIAQVVWPAYLVAAFLLGGVVSIFAELLRPRLRPARFIDDDGARPLAELLAPPPAAEESPRAAAIVDEVKEEYGRLLSDIVYRVERPALFDVAAPTTRAFTTALLRWDDTHHRLPGHELDALAAQVKLAFDAARANAETLGIRHAPAEAREPMERAAKALRLAASSTTDAERAAARRQALRILNSLTLYYLPDDDEAQTMIEGRRVLALPGRRPQSEAER